MKKNYKIKKTISVKQFISEFGENLSEHIKDRLLDLEVRSVLTRKEDLNRLDIKHVEHTLFDSNSEDNLKNSQKEYSFGQFIALEDEIYFSDSFLEGETIMASPIISEIYNNINSTDIISTDDYNAKKITDDNIDFIIDNILTVCPEVSQRYLDITQGMTSRAENKAKTPAFFKTYK